jgi:hypothetical protein
MKDQIRKSAKILAPIGALGGFISDVLTPLGPITKYLFICSLAICFILLILYVLNKKKLAQNYLPSSIILAIVFGGFFVLNNNTENGILGDNVESIANLQNSLFSIQETVDRVEDKVDVIDEKLDVRFDKIEDLIKSSNPIANPRTANDFILNAYLYKNSGNLPKSEYAFEQFFKLTGLEKYDLYLDYFLVLKTNYGKAKALDILKSTSESKFIDVIEIFEMYSGYKIYSIIEDFEGLPEKFKDWLLIYASNEAIMAPDSPFMIAETQDYAFIFKLYASDLQLGDNHEKVHQYFFNKSKAHIFITDDGPIYYNILSALQTKVPNQKIWIKKEIDKQMQRALDRPHRKDHYIELLKTFYGPDFDPYNYNLDEMVRNEIRQGYQSYFQTCTQCPDTSLFVDMHYNPPSLY